MKFEIGLEVLLSKIRNNMKLEIGVMLLSNMKLDDMKFEIWNSILVLGVINYYGVRNIMQNLYSVIFQVGKFNRNWKFEIVPN